MSTYGTPSQSTYSQTSNTIGDLLNQLPNNTSNLILAENIRNSVFTLWEKVEAVSASSTSSARFYNNSPVLSSVGGIPVGYTFSESKDINEIFNLALYPLTPPLVSMSTINKREYGNLDNITFSWTVTKQTYPITSIILVGESVNPAIVSGTKGVTGTYSSLSTPASTTQSFSMTASDGTYSTTKSTSITWNNNIYWGQISFTYSNFSEDPVSISIIGSGITSSTIKSLAGLTVSGVGNGAELSPTKSKTYDNINAGGNYLIFAWPTSVYNSKTPKFIVNGMTNTAFTKVKTFSFTNQFNFNTEYEVWVSNTRQNSTLDIIII